MMTRIFIGILIPLAIAAQTTGTLNLYPQDAAAEQAELNQIIQEANGSAVDLTRGFEQFLLKHPGNARRGEIEASLYNAAAESNDHPRIILYGAKVLAAKPPNELEIMERIIRALLASDDADSARTALSWVSRYEAAILDKRARNPEGHATAAQWTDLADRAFARATVLEARATGNMGKLEDAVNKATISWVSNPSAEAAHEIARWLVKLGRESEAIDHYADAVTVTVEDPRSPPTDRDRDRKQATELYTKIHGSTEGLGDVFLRSWDRTAAAARDRIARYQAIDRNYNVTDPFAFALPPVVAKNEPLDMAKLKGKTVVMDFWATWCMPCIAQHPLLEHVRLKYAKAADVVFLSVDADDDHSLVVPFLQAQQWDQRVYLEDGLCGLLNVAALPTILVIDPYGHVYSRMTGISMDSFENALNARIDEARSVMAPK